MMSLSVMIKNLLLGYIKLEADSKHAADIMDLCIKERLPYEKAKIKGEKFYLKLPASKSKAIKKLLSERNIDFIEKKGGLPEALTRYKKRYGLFAGFLLIILVLFFSERYVWDIRVSGNTTLEEDEVIAELADAGFYRGFKIGKEDVDKITNRLLIDSEKIAWISINLNGNVAYVTIREKIFSEGEFGKDLSTPSNIIAKRNGVVESIEVLRGTAVVKEGESILEGQLLISGISESTHGEYRAEHAIGRVYATTFHHFSLEVPLEYEEKIPKKTILTGLDVKFFSTRLNIFKNSGKNHAECDKIEEDKNLSLFGLPSLPFGIVTESCREYESKIKKRTYEEASSLAFTQLNELISSELGSGELLQKNLKTEFDENKFIITCDIVALENVAENVTVKINDKSE